METFDAATIFWLIAMGLVIGGAIKVAFGNKALGLVPNLLGGVFGTITAGFIGISIEFAGSMFLAMLGSMAIVFLANVFNVVPESEDH